MSSDYPDASNHRPKPGLLAAVIESLGGEANLVRFWKELEQSATRNAWKTRHRKRLAKARP